MPPMICFRRLSTSWRVQLYRRLFWTISRAETTTPPDPEAALLDALNSGKVKAAGLDVWLSEKDPNWALASHPAVSCTPHIGAGTKEAQKRIGAELVDIVENFG